MNTNNSLLKSINTVAEGVVSSASFDITRSAVIAKNNNNGTYDIQLDGVTYQSISAYGGSTEITKGTVVKVVFPCNQASQMFIVSPVAGGGEPDTYLKSASISGNTLTLTNQDDTAIPYTPNIGADYVTEIGTSGNWRYKKWNSGYVEAWYKGDSKSYAVTSTSGGIKYAALETVLYPSDLFIENPDAWASWSNQTQGDTDNAWITIRENTTTNIKFYVNRGASATITGRVHIYAFGTWK